MAKKNAKTTTKRQETRPNHGFKRGNPYRWKPGESGCPEGRAGQHRDDWRDFMHEIDNPNVPKTRLRKLQEVCHRKAMQGSVRHAEICLDRGWGKPTAYIESVSLHGNLADTISAARKRVETGLKLPRPLPALPEETIQTAPEKEQAPGAASRQVNVELTVAKQRPN